MSVVKCSRDEVVECSGLEPCWYGVGRLYLLIIGVTRVSQDFRSGVVKRDGPVKSSWVVSLLGFGIGMINDDFHIAGI